MKRLFLCFCLISGSLLLGISAGAQSEMGLYRPKPVVTVGKVPAIELERDLTASPSEAAEIKQHIANLKKIDHPDYGFCSTATATAFTPVASSANFEGGILEDARIGDQAKPTFVRYLKNASSQRLETMKLVLQETHPEWAAELLH